MDTEIWRDIVGDLGEVTAGYRIRDGKWTEIGRMSPHKPQVGQLVQVLVITLIYVTNL